METIWRGDYGHANIANDISLPPVDIPLNPNAVNIKLKQELQDMVWWFKTARILSKIASCQN